MLSARALGLAVLVAAVREPSVVHPQHRAADLHTGSDAEEAVDRGESASFDVRCDVCKSLIADLSAVAEPVRQNLKAGGTTGSETTVAETTAHAIVGMCDRRQTVPRLLGLYKLHDCDEEDAVARGPVVEDESYIGALVSLADGYEDQGDAQDGPLLPGQTATLGAVMQDKVMVTLASGKQWWDLYPALQLVRSPPCAEIKTPQRYAAEHYTDASTESMRSRTSSDAVRAWEVHAHRIMCLRYWAPLAEDIGDFIAESDIVSDAEVLEFCMEKGLCKENRPQRRKTKEKHQKKRGTSKQPGKKQPRPDEL